MAEKSQIVKCPVCKCKIWSHALKIHITNSGAREVYYLVNDLLDYSPDKKFKPTMFLQCRHYKYRREHIINKKVFELKNGTKIQGRRQSK